MTDKDYASICHRYAREAAKNKGGQFCKWMRLAGQRHIEDRKRARAKDFPYTFEPWYCNDVCEFIERLPHVRGEWETQNIRLEDWQVFVVGSIFGWRLKSDKSRRRFRTAYLECGRKNAKSTLAAGIALYCLAYDGEQGPQILVGATTEKQCNHVFLPAKAMAQKLPDFQSAKQIEVTAEKISCWHNWGTIERLTASAKHELGWNPHLVVLDELAVHADEELFKVVRSAFGARKNSLLLMISTAGPDINGICYQQRSIATNVLEGDADIEHFFGAIYTVDEGDAEFDPEVWPKANPNLGVSCSVEELQGLADEAKRSNPIREELMMRRLNMWLESRSGWLNMGQWNACAGQVHPEHLPGMVWYGGLDLAATSDFAAFVLVGMDQGRVKLYPKLYISEEGARQRSLKNLPVEHWGQQGLVTITPGEITDYEQIERDIIELHRTYRVVDIAADSWNAWHLIDSLQKQQVRVRIFRQGPQSYHPVMTAFQRHLVAGTLDHPDNPALNWMASNIVARTDINMNTAPDRKRSADKIDGIAAALMAFSGCMGHEESKSGRVFPIELERILEQA